jgi:HD-GYP domain-containing protein (c-di-GMP phosphodiesterase class II)
MTHPTTGPGGWGTTRSWERRPWLALSLRALVFLVPVLLAVGASILLGHLLPRPTQWWHSVLWWLAVVAGTLLVLAGADHLCRRALPLAALYELSLLFPDRAPKRFRVWRRGGSVAQLRAELEALTSDASGRGPEAAQRVLTLVAALSVHDPRTRGHAERVRILTDMLAEEMRLPEQDRHMLRWASLLHDIGKLSVPASVLRKADVPDESEWVALRRHPEEGDRLLGAVREWLGPWASAVAHHHEHYDGSGYPRGLRGEEISLGGRIVALADAFEAMTARRPYSRPLSPRVAREELVRRAGTQFDPEVCRAFLSISVGRLWRVVGLAAGVAQVPLAASLAGASGRVGPTATSGGSVVIAGTLAAVLGILPVVGVPNTAPHSPRSAVAGASIRAPQVPEPAPLPAPVVGTPLQSAQGPVAPSGSAPGTVALASRSGAAPGSPSAAQSPARALSVSLSVRPRSVHRGTEYTVAGTLASPCGGCTVLVSWGDGSRPQAIALDALSFATAHTYAGKGRYTITVTVVQNRTPVGSATHRVVVNNG